MIKPACGQTTIPQVDNSEQPCEQYISSSCVISDTAYTYGNIQEGDTSNQIVEKLLTKIKELGKKILLIEKKKYENIYSTDETAVGEYLGKVLYRKMIPHTFNGDYSFTIIHNLDIATYVRVDFISNSSNDTNPVLPSKFKLTLIEYILKVEDGNGWLYDESPNVLSFGADGIHSDGETGYIILEYTKN